MKKILFGFVITLLLVCSFAIAEEGVVTDNTEKVIAVSENESLTESVDEVALDAQADESLGFFYNLGQNLKLALIRNKEKRAELALRIANEKMAQVNKISKLNDPIKLEKALARQEKAQAKADKLIEKLETEDAKNVEAIERIRNKTQEQTAKVSEIKTRILERQKDKMTPEQITHLEEVFAKIEAKAQERMEKKLEVKKQIKEKLQERNETKTGLKEQIQKNKDEINATKAQIQERKQVKVEQKEQMQTQ
ncbi:hypothetical protein J4403_00935 [Candidatus Woesearchaeota archaeon]|nr:hypothetical protein [Candidatus Woesearchaeota archaeon]